MKKIYTLLFAFIILFSNLHAQNIPFEKTYRKAEYNGTYTGMIAPGADGNYVGGVINASAGTGQGECGVVKLNPSGDILWSKVLSDYDISSVRPTPDAGVIVLGAPISAMGGIIKFSSTGTVQWNRYTDSIAVGWDIQPTSDGGYVIAGSQLLDGYDWPLFIKLDGSGNSSVSTLYYIASAYEIIRSVYQTTDGGYILAGEGSPDNDYNKKDVFLLKIDASYAIQWAQTYSAPTRELVSSVIQTSDGGYLLSVSSMDTISYLSSAVIIKTNSTGNVTWSKAIGGNEVYNAIEAPGGGYLFLSPIVEGVNQDQYYPILIKTDANGTVQFAKKYGDGTKILNYINKIPSGGFMLSGGSFYDLVDFSYEGYLVKTDNNGNTGCGQTAYTPTVSNKTWTVTNITNVYSYPGTNVGWGTIAVPSAVTYTDSTHCSGCASGVPVCLVTVDNATTQNLVVWEKPVSTDIDSFRIYRDIVGTYTHIGSVDYGDLSKFIDNTNGVNPTITSYKYKISVKDVCGYESPLSDFHKTIHLQKNGTNLTWDNYSGFASAFYYRILSDTIGNGNFIVRDSVTNANFTWTDPNPPVLSTGDYVIEIVHPSGGCTATKSVENHNSSRSNRTNAAPPGPEAVNNIYKNDFISISPNPCNGRFTIKTANIFSDKIQESVYNYLGEVIHQSIIDPELPVEIDLSNQPSGIYFINIKSGEKNYYRKLIKE